jgi:hypothetical protein
MANKAIFITALLLFMAADAYSQGYVGTVLTGTGILDPITVGKSSIGSSSVGALTAQANLSGTWALDLSGTQSRHFELQVLQKGDLISGRGQISDGEMILPVTVAGSTSGDRPTIFISVIDSGQTFRVKLSHSGTSISGEYDSLSGTGTSESGTATGQLALSSPADRTTVLGNGTNPSASSGAYVGRAARSVS